MALEISRRQLAIGAALVAAGLAAWFLFRDRPLPPEQAVNALIDAGLAAAEEGDVGDLMDLVSQDYQAEGNGPESRAELRQYLSALLFRGGAGIEVLSREVVLDDDQHGATVHLTVLLTRGGLRGLAEGNAGARDITLRVALEGEDWKVVSSRHESALE
jgi:hypothetical protein